jgi:hypothetical protein
MTRLREGVVAVLMCAGMAWPLAAANDANDFYKSLLQRGIGHVDGGQYETGERELRIAAFGLVDAIPEFETAQVYLTIVGDRLHSEADARRALQRIIAADRVQRRFGSLSLRPRVRAEFDLIASKLLTSDQYAFLKASPTAEAGTTTMTPQHSSAPAPVPQPASSNPKPPPVAAPTPAPMTPAPAPAPLPAPVPRPAPAPVKQASRPKPQPTRPQPTPQPPTPTPAPVLDVNAMATADKAVDNNDLAGARKIYDRLASDPSLDHATLIHLGMQSYRARDFATAVRAFGRSGFTAPEAPYRYYYAVALYETGQPAAAKRELSQALPYIEVTPDIAAYRDKIENAR